MLRRTLLISDLGSAIFSEVLSVDLNSVGTFRIGEPSIIDPYFSAASVRSFEPAKDVDVCR